MKHLYKFIFIAALVLPSVLAAQLSILSTVPSNNAVNVSLTTTISVAFDAALDTVFMSGKQPVFSNIQINSSPYFSSDAKTFIANVQLQSNTAYFLTFFFAKAKDGSTMTAPYTFYFTTGAAFPSISVSGTVLPGSSGVSPEHSFVALSSTNFQNSNSSGPPEFAMAATVNNDGTFTIPYVSNGTYFPLAAKDVNGDGEINPDLGTDVVGFSDSIIVNGASITGLSLTFMNFTPMLLSEARPIADSLSKDLGTGFVLKRISSYNMDTLGRGKEWEFQYYSSTASIGFGIQVSPTGSSTGLLDQNQSFGLQFINALVDVNLAAPSSTVIANVEAAGGKAFRDDPTMIQYRFESQATLGDMDYSQFGNMPHDQAKQYWGVQYAWYDATIDTNWIFMKQELFLCDFSTGAVLTSTGVKGEGSTVPSSFALFQNYPNPFNPTTVISYQLPMNSFVSLKVYDVIGREVATLVNGMQETGVHNVQLTMNSKQASSGVYFYTLRAHQMDGGQEGSFTATKKLVLMK